MEKKPLYEQPLLLNSGIEYKRYPRISDNYILNQIKPTLPNDNKLSLYDGLYEFKSIN